MGSPNSKKYLKFAQELWKGSSHREAYLAAGYKDTASIDSLASKLAKHPEVQKELEKIKQQARDSINKEAILRRLEGMSRGAITDYLVKKPITVKVKDENGNSTTVTEDRWTLDMERLKKDKKGYLLTKVNMLGTNQFSLHIPNPVQAIHQLAILMGWEQEAANIQPPVNIQMEIVNKDKKIVKKDAGTDE